MRKRLLPLLLTVFFPGPSAGRGRAPIGGGRSGAVRTGLFMWMEDPGTTWSGMARNPNPGPASFTRWSIPALPPRTTGWPYSFPGGRYLQPTFVLRRARRLVWRLRKAWRRTRRLRPPFGIGWEWGPADRFSGPIGPGWTVFIWWMRAFGGKGAALHCDGVSPTITNCVFVNNRTLIPDPWDPASHPRDRK